MGEALSRHAPILSCEAPHTVILSCRHALLSSPLLVGDIAPKQSLLFPTRCTVHGRAARTHSVTLALKLKVGPHAPKTE